MSSSIHAIFHHRCLKETSLLLLAQCFILFSGCSERGSILSHEGKGIVIIYTSWDQPHSSPILARFEKESGIEVQVVYDTEASKTTGLVNRLIAEKNNPKADVFWNSEIVRTILLKQKGVLEPYQSRYWHETPEHYRDPDAYWTGFAARARVLFSDAGLNRNAPQTYAELLDPKWHGQFAIANPLFGTTSTNVAVWFEKWGADRTEKYLLALKNNGAVIAAGNGAARDMVVDGEIAICVTDTDDAWGAISNGREVVMTFPDQGPEGEGTLLIPNTVCLIKDAKHPENAKKLIDFLLSREVEQMLAYSRAAQIPLKDDVAMPDHVREWAEKKYMKVDFEAAVDALPEAMRFVHDKFLE